MNNRRIFLPEISACCQDRNDQHKTSDKNVFVHSDLRLRETNRSGLYMWKFITSSPNVIQRSLRHPGYGGREHNGSEEDKTAPECAMKAQRRAEV